MEKITAWLENGTNVVDLGDSFIEMNTDSRIVINNVAIYWRFKNVHKDNYEVTLVETNGTQTVLQFGTGYWTFGMISEPIQVGRRKPDEEPTQRYVPHTLRQIRDSPRKLRSLARLQKGHRDNEGNQNGQR